MELLAQDFSYSAIVSDLNERDSGRAKAVPGAAWLFSI